MLEDNIKNLIKILEDSSIDEIDISTFWGKQRIRIRKNNIIHNDHNIEINKSSSVNLDQNIKNKHSNEEIEIKSDTNIQEVIKTDNLSFEKKSISIKSPLVGTFYISSKPGDPPFISVGDLIKEGQIICIIEAMKIFNEIESEVSGRVENIFIKDSTPVEYDQALISINPE